MLKPILGLDKIGQVYRSSMLSRVFSRVLTSK